MGPTLQNHIIETDTHTEKFLFVPLDSLEVFFWNIQLCVKEIALPLFE